MPFYVGTLFYAARVGASEPLFQTHGTTCSFVVHVPGQAAGTVPVWASQYGGGGPWVPVVFCEPPGCGRLAAEKAR
jgi:hypothetical protein